ncbi:suppressor of fused domain protein [Agromyces albus]|uniref:suppressor of fused domain protein n=1 Tax=Agromyces albus TaxID=205332 RepID=UPI00278A87BB|nr:suppressor of fused domain protein [Agromyces albus]MDQ0577190.1 hypothetical protein [Agromyces albus]
MFPGATTSALYVTAPVYFPDEFATVREAGHDVVIAWLVPITTSEAEYVKAHGWERFEDVLVEQAPDLIDFSRAAVQP